MWIGGTSLAVGITGNGGNVGIPGKVDTAGGSVGIPGNVETAGIDCNAGGIPDNVDIVGID